MCGSDGIAIFDALHRHGTVSEAMLYAFDLYRKKQQARLVGRRRRKRPACALSG